MNYVSLVNNLQIRIIELVYKVDACANKDKFNEIMMCDLKNGAHLKNRIKFNAIEPQLREYLKKSHLNNNDYDEILFKFDIIHKRHFSV